jgi:nitrite reductase/ring-hydroxylating ferredoxin subunit
VSDCDWPVGRLRDLPAGAAREFSIGAGDWPFRGFVVHWEGQVYAYENTCPHAGHPLNLDPDRFFAPDGATLICRSHGALFEPASGLCVAGPCAGARLRALPCRVQAGEIRVRIPGET